MTPKSKLNPLFFAPFVSSTFRVEPAWIDENDHLNMAYFNVLFEKGLDEALNLIGVTRNYVGEKRGTLFIGECHLRYRREILLETPVRITIQLIDYDEKRLHIYMEMRESAEGWLAATSEVLILHVDPTIRRVAPFPADILDEIAVMHSAHSVLPRPENLGSVIAIPAKAKSSKVEFH